MENTLQAWNLVKQELQNRNIVAPEVFHELITPIQEIYKETNTTVFLIVKDNLVKFRLEKFYLESINKLFVEISQINKRIKLITHEQIEEEKKTQSDFQFNKVSSLELNKNQRNLRGEYTFENFVTGKTNRFAFITASKVAESPVVTINPLYIFGDVGLGKTHLMTAIGHYILDKNPSANVIYTTAQQFTEDYFNATTKKNPNAMQEFSDFYKSADVLLVDDIQFLANKNATQEEFFKLFEYLYSQNKQMVITSDRKAEELENIMARLKSRFSWGNPVDIQKPDFELRQAIVKQKLCSLINNPDDVSDEAINFIAENFYNNIRELEGALRRFVNYCVAFCIDYSLDNAKTALDSLIVSVPESNEESDFKHIDKIKKAISKYYSVSVTDLSSSTRKKEVVFPRQIAIYIIRNKFNIPLKRIGDYFGSRDHTTIAHACSKIEKSIEEDWTIKQDVENILKLIDKE
ncbi:MAG: chromosomal replication initiator protein DnaA [Bacilli bacterium]|nr:chromosomal replication initiator protein DnaA [Bacilli bacterium]